MKFIQTFVRDWLDAVLAALFAATGLLVLLICWKIQGVQADESTYIYGALEMLKGQVIYRDFWVFYPPGIFFLAVGAFTVIGKSLFAVRLVLVLGACVSTALLYLLGTRFMSRFWAAAGAALFLLLGVNLWPVFGHHWNSTFALILSAFFMVLYLDAGRNRFLMLSGLFAGATLLLQLHKGVPYVAVVMFTLLIAGVTEDKWTVSAIRKWVRNGFVFSVCALIPVGVTILYLAKIGAVREAVDATIMFPLRNMAGAGNPDYGAPYGAFTIHVLGYLMKFLNVPGITEVAVKVVAVVILILVPISALLVPFVLLLRKDSFSRGKYEVPLFIALSSLACLASAAGRPDFHHLVTSVPLGYLALVFVVSEISPHIPQQRGPIALKIVSYTFATLILVPAVWVGTGSVAFGSRVTPVYLDSPLGFVVLPTEKELDMRVRTPYEVLITDIKMKTSPDEKILSVPSSAFLYYLADRPSVSRFPMLLSSMRNAEQMTEIVRDLERDRTRWVILDPVASWKQFKAALPYADEEAFRRNTLLQYIHEHYRENAAYGGFVLMERNQEELSR